jgi:hypothetical protein
MMIILIASCSYFVGSPMTRVTSVFESSYLLLLPITLYSKQSTFYVLMRLIVNSRWSLIKHHVYCVHIISTSNVSFRSLSSSNERTNERSISDDIQRLESHVSSLQQIKMSSHHRNGSIACCFFFSSASSFIADVLSRDVTYCTSR